jgi:probable DNA metabolism protein
MLYIFDGSQQGFLTAFVAGFSDERAQLSSKCAQLPLGEKTIAVETDEGKANRALRRLLCFDKQAEKDLDILLRCGETDNEQVAFAYFRKLAQRKRPVRDELACPDVYHAVEYMKKVRYEIHRFHGFIRFMECESGALYAPFSPDNDICDLLLPHFRARLPAYPFVLHDVKRKKAAVYDGKNTFVAYLDTANVVISANEEDWQALWKQYYRAVNIPERERLKQMRGYLPARYWAFLPEKQD